MTTLKTKPLAKMPFPMFDADQLAAVQQRNVDALANASQIVVDGAKAIALRQGEMVQASMENLMAFNQNAWSGKAVDMKPVEQVEKFKSSYEAAVSNTRELTEIAMKAQQDAFGVLTKCVMANIDDMKAMAATA